MATTDQDRQTKDDNTSDPSHLLSIDSPGSVERLPAMATSDEDRRTKDGKTSDHPHSPGSVEQDRRISTQGDNPSNPPPYLLPIHEPVGRFAAMKRSDQVRQISTQGFSDLMSSSGQDPQSSAQGDNTSDHLPLLPIDTPGDDMEVWIRLRGQANESWASLAIETSQAESLILRLQAIEKKRVAETKLLMAKWKEDQENVAKRLMAQENVAKRLMAQENELANLRSKVNWTLLLVLGLACTVGLLFIEGKKKPMPKEPKEKKKKPKPKEPKEKINQEAELVKHLKSIEEEKKKESSEFQMPKIIGRVNVGLNELISDAVKEFFKHLAKKLVQGAMKP